jgi:hypothetical protein
LYTLLWRYWQARPTSRLFCLSFMEAGSCLGRLPMRGVGERNLQPVSPKITIRLPTWHDSIDSVPILCYHCNQSVSLRGSCTDILNLSYLFSFGQYIGFVIGIPFCEGASTTCFQYFPNVSSILRGVVRLFNVLVKLS